MKLKIKWLQRLIWWLRMDRECSWCRRIMHRAWFNPRRDKTSGICPTCSKELMERWRLVKEAGEKP
jgi:hypothetical protein